MDEIEAPLHLGRHVAHSPIISFVGPGPAMILEPDTSAASVGASEEEEEEEEEEDLIVLSRFLPFFFRMDGYISLAPPRCPTRGPNHVRQQTAAGSLGVRSGGGSCFLMGHQEIFFA